MFLQLDNANRILHGTLCGSMPVFLQYNHRRLSDSRFARRNARTCAQRVILNGLISEQSSLTQLPWRNDACHALPHAISPSQNCPKVTLTTPISPLRQWPQNLNCRSGHIDPCLPCGQGHNVASLDSLALPARPRNAPNSPHRLSELWPPSDECADSR